MGGFDAFAVGARRPVPTRVSLGSVEFDVRCLSLKADGKGEDALLVANGFAGIADGSTPLDPAKSGEVAEFARATLEQLYRRRGGRSTTEQLRRTLLWHRSRGADATSPTCTLGFVQTHGRGIVAGNLADAVVVIKLRNGTYTVLRDWRVDRWDRRSAEILKRALDCGHTPDEARQAARRNVARQRREALNRPGGYWVMGANPDAADEAWTLCVESDGVDAILICSDGFSRVADTFGLVNGYEDLLELCLRNPLEEIGETLRRYEAAPDSLRLRPRTSVHDDASAIVLRRTDPSR